MLIGHGQACNSFLEALGRGRLHHAWLITGPKGIGKRRFADWAARELLSDGPGQDRGRDRENAAALVSAGSHPDHRVLTPPQEGKGSATGSIVVEQVRELSEFLHTYPAISGWRVLIVDSIDDMNLNTSNAFLKELEEPRERTVYLLVSNAPARLLPTIRSRCRTLRLFPLSKEETRNVLEADNPDLPAAQIERLSTMANGAPGAVADMAGTDLGGLEVELDRIAAGGEGMALARSVQPQAAIPRLRALLALVPRRIAIMARRNPDPHLIDLYAEAEVLSRDAIRLAYDRQQVAMALADITARAGRIQENR